MFIYALLLGKVGMKMTFFESLLHVKHCIQCQMMNHKPSHPSKMR